MLNYSTYSYSQFIHKSTTLYLSVMLIVHMCYQGEQLERAYCDYVFVHDMTVQMITLALKVKSVPLCRPLGADCSLDTHISIYRVFFVS